MIVDSTAFNPVGILVASQVALYYTVRWIVKSIDSTAGLKSKGKTIVKKLGYNLSLNEYEQTIASEIIWPDDLTTTFEDVGGLDSIIHSLQETIIYPLMYPDIYSSISGILGPPKGVLLHGPPGCGKTMLAKALAKEAGAVFINLRISTLGDKWFGESQKLVNAVFTLAQKVQPCIIFIDEIDSFLRTRTSSDHEATSQMKAEFMTLWDGLVSANSSRIIILGATNRIQDIDQAILRRMPRRFHISLPILEQRERVLRLLLNKIVTSPDLSIHQIAALTRGYSCSDLKELCRNAVMMPVRESIRIAQLNSEIGQIESGKLTVRPVSMNDFKAFIDGSFDSFDSDFLRTESLD